MLIVPLNSSVRRHSLSTTYDTGPSRRLKGGVGPDAGGEEGGIMRSPDGTVERRLYGDEKDGRSHPVVASQVTEFCSR